MVSGISQVLYSQLYRLCLNMDVKFLVSIHQGLIFVEVSNLDSIVWSKLEVWYEIYIVIIDNFHFFLHL
jgi:hypothetical protein